MKSTSQTAFVQVYESWYENHSVVLDTEIAALKKMLPASHNMNGLEVGTGTGIFSKALGLNQGIESCEMMRELAVKRGIQVTNAAATALPFDDQHFDFVLLNLCNPFFHSMFFSFSEAHRVLKTNGSCVVCFFEKQSPFEKSYLSHQSDKAFFSHCNFFPTQKVLFEMNEAGFHELNVAQTLFHNISETKEPEALKPGFGEGSFVVVKATKNKKMKGTSFNMLFSQNEII
jgi:ubiquinone/menaquinone biosynthesis C-methylase UbiE